MEIEDVAAYGIGLSLFLVSNPIGWVSALVIGSVGASISYAGGKGATVLYSSLGEDIDVANFTKIDSLCTGVFNTK